MSSSSHSFTGMVCCHFVLLDHLLTFFHFSVEESKQLGANAPNAAHGTTKVFTDLELEQMIDPILQMDDKNNDGFIDYSEFVSAQRNRGF